MAKNDTPEDILRRIIKEGTQTAAVEQAKVALAQLEETKKQTELLDKIEKKKDSSVERSTKKTKEERKEYKEKEEGRLSRVTQKVSSGRGQLDGTLGNIAKTIGAGTIAASVGSVPNLRGVAAATLDAAGVGGLVTLGGGGGAGGRRSAASTSGGGKNPGKESVGILESILNVLQDNNELLQDLLSSLTAAARGRIEAEREANRKAGEASKGVRDEGEDSEKQSFLGKWGTIIAAALGSVYGIIQGWLKTVKYFAEALLPESLIKSIKGKFAAVSTFIEETVVSIKKTFSSIGTFFDDIFVKLKGVFSERFEKIGAAFEEVFAKITNLFKGIGEESKLGKVISSIGGAITKLTAPFIEAFEIIKTITAGPASKIGTVFESIGGFFGKFSGIFEGVSSTAGKMMGFLDSFAGTFKFVSNIVGKLALPLMIVMTVWDTVKGMIEGYEKDGIVGAISGAVTGFFNSLIFGPLDMLKDAAAWVLGKLGFENAEKALNSFSFSEMFTSLVTAIVNSVKSYFESIQKSFDEFIEKWTKGDYLGAISAILLAIPNALMRGLGSLIESAMSALGFTDAAAKIKEYLKDKDIVTVIKDAFNYVFKTITDFFTAIPGMISTFVTDQIKKMPGGEALLKYLTPAESSSSMAAGRGAEREVLTAITKTGYRNVKYTTNELKNDQRFNEAGPTFNNQEQPTFTGSASANFGNSMADLMPIENPTAPAFLKRVNDLAISASTPAAPIIIDNSTKNNVTNSRPSSISPRVSSGTPSTAPVVSHMERAHLATVGVTP
jgi:phage-related protein